MRLSESKCCVGRECVWWPVYSTPFWCFNRDTVKLSQDCSQRHESIGSIPMFCWHEIIKMYWNWLSMYIANAHLLISSRTAITLVKSLDYATQIHTHYPTESCTLFQNPIYNTQNELCTFLSTSLQKKERLNLFRVNRQIELLRSRPIHGDDEQWNGQWQQQ